MKHLLLTSAMILAFSIGFSKTKSIRHELDYVVTQKGIFLPEDVKSALTGNLFMNNTGLNFTLKISDIQSIHINGREFRLKYVKESDTNYAKVEILEKIRTRGEYTIYKRVSARPGSLNINDYVLYRGKDQEQLRNIDNYRVVLNFFLPEYKEMIASL